MIKTLYLEKCIFGTFLNQVASQSFGILISQTSFQDQSIEYAFLAFESPLENDAENIETHEQNFSNISPDWIANHAINVSRMLPGGIHVCGFFAFLPHSELKRNESIIKKICKTLYSRLKENRDSIFSTKNHDDLLFKNLEFQEQYLCLLINPNKDVPLQNKLLCKSFNIITDKSRLSTTNNLNNVDVKLKSFISDWRRIDTRINISIDAEMPKDRSKEKIFSQFKLAVQPFLEKIVARSSILINGRIPEDDEVIFNDDQTVTVTNQVTNSALRRSGSLPPINFANPDLTSNSSVSNITNSISDSLEGGFLRNLMPEISLIGPLLPFVSTSAGSFFNGDESFDQSHDANRDCTISGDNYLASNGHNNLRIQGRIPGLAFVPYDCRAIDAARFLKEDIIRSIHTRLDLLADELQIMGGEVYPMRMLMPQRVLVSLPACPSMPLSDYKFISETSEDVVSRLRYFCRSTSGLGSGGAGNLLLGTSSVAGTLFAGSSSTSGVSSGQLTPAWSMSGGTEPGSEIDEHCIDPSLELVSDEVSEEGISDADALEEIEMVSNTVSKNSYPIIVGGLSILVLLLSVILHFYFNK